MRPRFARTWIEISGSALRANLKQAEQVSKKMRIIPVMKANAYGHGQTLVAEALKDADVPFFAVDSLQEALSVQAVAPRVPLLILGYVSFDALEEVITRGFSFVCSKEETLNEAARFAAKERPARVHIEVETGLYRQGADANMLERLLLRAREWGDRVIVEGVCTHFSNAEDLQEDNGYPALQEERFAQAVKRVEAEGFAPTWRHIACSAAIWLRVSGVANAARLGISLYGLWSSSLVRDAMQKQHPDQRLEPVITWKTIIAEIKSVPQGEPVSYDLTERVTRPSVIAVLPVGYADGIDRRLSSCGEVLVQGKRCKILGRVCMNMCMIDVTNLPSVALEEEVVIFGTSGQDRITPEAWEQLVPGMIAYEAVAGLRQDIPRVLVDRATS